MALVVGVPRWGDEERDLVGAEADEPGACIVAALRVRARLSAGDHRFASQALPAHAVAAGEHLELDDVGVALVEGGEHQVASTGRATSPIHLLGTGPAPG